MSPALRLVDDIPPPRRSATEVYDQLSEVLRERPRHAGDAYVALGEADQLFSELDGLLRSGELPEPWLRRGNNE